MSNLVQTISFVGLGIGIGLGAFAILQEPTPPAPRSNPPVEHQHAPPNADPAPAEPSPDGDDAGDAEAVEFSLDLSKAFGDDRQLLGHFQLTEQPDADVDRVRLDVVTNGATVQDVYGYDWEETTDGVSIDVGEGDGRHPVILLQREGPSAELTAHVSFRDRSGAEALHVTGSPTTAALDATMFAPAVEVYVCQALTLRALERAEELRDDGEFEEALSALEDARAWNAEVGLALRVSGELKAQQARIHRLRTEIERERDRPKAQPRPKEPGIAIMYGDGTHQRSR